MVAMEAMAVVILTLTFKKTDHLHAIWIAMFTVKYSHQRKWCI